MSRYLERAEHTARLIDVNLNMILDQSPTSAIRYWGRLLDSLLVPVPTDEANDAYNLTRMLTFESSNKSSLVACLTAARENAQQIREQLSSEMWEQLNRIFLYVKRTGIHEVWHTQPHEFFRAIKEGVHLFQGITDSTMNQGEGWHFIQVGRFIERASATATSLGVYFKELQSPTNHTLGARSYLDWVALLKSCTAFEAYCKVYTADLRPEYIAEFLLLNPEFPRSVRFAAERIQNALQAIAETTQTRKAGRLDKLAGRLRSALSFSQIDEVMSNGLHRYLEDIQRQCAQIHTTIYEIYIAYSIESAFFER
jgi:uncharacterized alpha-E superfamily protein